MPLSQKEIAVAKQMRSFVRMYETFWQFTLRPKFAFWYFLMMTVIGLIGSQTWERVNHYTLLGAVVVMILLGFVHRHVASRYFRDRAMLQILEREHYDELPWHHPPPLPRCDRCAVA